MACDRNDGGEGAFEERIAVLESGIFVGELGWFLVISATSNGDSYGDIVNWKISYAVTIQCLLISCCRALDTEVDTPHALRLTLVTLVR
jgi:hypothetical protein